MNALQTLTLRYLAVAVLATNLASTVVAQGTRDPISGSAPIAHWSLVLEDVVRVPNTGSNLPRLEYMIVNSTTGLAYVIEQRGRIHTFDPTAAAPTTNLLMDLNTAVGSLFYSGEAGVRGIAFHPEFDNALSPGHRKMYLSFSRDSATAAVGNSVTFGSPGTTNHYAVLAEFELDAAGAVDTSSYRELMRIEQPFGNHNSGHIGFNPTAVPGDADYGNLYIAVGDGGSGGGPFDLSQDIDLSPAPYPHGKILRIDPLAAGASPYSVPADNPFAGQANRVQEMWAYGLRNPHKFEWDSATGEMYISDIGQGAVEEISVGRPGANYGWNEREGAYVFAGSVTPLPAGHADDEFTYPVAQYDHIGTNGITSSSAIVGGPVYRGDKVPELTGVYLFADFATNPGPIFAVDVDDLIERDDFSNIEDLDGGFLAPFVETRIRHDGEDKTHLDFIKDVTGRVNTTRTDIRWATDDEGEVYVMTKRDGWIRRIVGVAGLALGDANRDGMVDGLDLARWENAFGLAGDWSDGNFDASPVTDGDDFVLWQRNSGGSVPSATVPEPSTLTLLATSALLLLVTRNGRAAA